MKKLLIGKPLPTVGPSQLGSEPKGAGSAPSTRQLTPQVPGALFNLEVNGNMKLKSLSESK